ncbi:MAG: ABC transporter ATP-binding protein [Cyclobacteriaceae bacterium]|nr:ABC transporter ATP-binding protein [Cyclobacteriaceae bacterium]
MENHAIEIHGLTKKYGDYKAVDNLNLSLSKGEIFGLLGPNGAGKSTTILMLLGLTEPHDGSLRVFGIDPVRNPVEVKKLVGYLPEDVGFYENMSGLENLIYTAQLNGLGKSEAKVNAEEILKRVGLEEHIHKKAGKYSRGMRQRLGLADVLIKKPHVIILDEPTLGIDPSGIREFLELIVKLSKEEGITVMFSSHHLHQVQKVCDRVGIFVKGKLLAVGDVQSLANQLFSENAYSVSAEILPNTLPQGVDALKEAILAIDNVIKVDCQDNHFHIESSEDVTDQIAEVIVKQGAGLCHLSKKDYGLDDIYYKYFEGE